MMLGTDVHTSGPHKFAYLNGAKASHNIRVGKLRSFTHMGFAFFLAIAV